MDKPSLETPKIRTVRWLRLKQAALASLALAVVIGTGFGLNYTAKPAFCGSCHQMEAYLTSWKEAGHKETACLACHRDQGLLGGATYRIGMIKYLNLSKIYLRRHRPPLATDGQTNLCLRCHQKVARQTVQGATGIRISHKEIIEAGLGCARCHQSVGHESKSNNMSRGRHDYCFTCHDVGQSEQRCAFCHTKDILAAGPDQLDRYRRVSVHDINECTSCHSTNGCRECHTKPWKALTN